MVCCKYLDRGRHLSSNLVGTTDELSAIGHRELKSRSPDPRGCAIRLRYARLHKGKCIVSHYY